MVEVPITCEVKLVLNRWIKEHEIRSYDEFKQYYNGQGGD